MILLSTWCGLDSDLAVRFEETMKYILGFLLAKARSTPFVGGDALVTIDPDGDYSIYEFPGLLRFPPNYPLDSP